MKCPACSSYASQEIDLHSEQFAETIRRCETCGCEWSDNHGLIEVIRDAQEDSFLESRAEAVEGDDYNRPSA